MKQNEYSKDDIKKVKAAPVEHHQGLLVLNLLRGMPDYNKKHAPILGNITLAQWALLHPTTKFLKDPIQVAIRDGAEVLKDRKDIEEKKAKIALLVFQERIREQVHIQSEAIEEWLEIFTVTPEKFDPKGFDFKAFSR